MDAVELARRCTDVLIEFLSAANGQSPSSDETTAEQLFGAIATRLMMRGGQGLMNRLQNETEQEAVRPEVVTAIAEEAKTDPAFEARIAELLREYASRPASSNFSMSGNSKYIGAGGVDGSKTVHGPDNSRTTTKTSTKNVQQSHGWIVGLVVIVIGGILLYFAFAGSDGDKPAEGSTPSTEAVADPICRDFLAMSSAEEDGLANYWWSRHPNGEPSPLLAARYNCGESPNKRLSEVAP